MLLTAFLLRFNNIMSKHKNANMDTFGITEAIRILTDVLNEVDVDENEIRYTISLLENLESEHSVSKIRIYDPEDFSSCANGTCGHILPFKKAKKFDLEGDSDYATTG